MQTLFRSGDVKLNAKLSTGIPELEISNKGIFLFATSNPKTLMDISKVIADFATELNKETQKEMVDHNKALDNKEKEIILEK